MALDGGCIPATSFRLTVKCLRPRQVHTDLHYYRDLSPMSSCCITFEMLPSVEDVYRLLLNRYFLKYHHLGIQCRHVTIVSALLPISVDEYLMASKDISRFEQHQKRQDKKWTTSNIIYPKSTASLNDSQEKSLSFQTIFESHRVTHSSFIQFKSLPQYTRPTSSPVSGIHFRALLITTIHEQTQ